MSAEFSLSAGMGAGRWRATVPSLSVTALNLEVGRTFDLNPSK